MSRKILMLSLLLVASVAVAMPTNEELTEAHAQVKELMEPQFAANKARKASATDVADTAMGYLPVADTEGVKFELLKCAATYYAKGKNYDKATEAVE